MKWEKFRGGPLSGAAQMPRVTLNRKGLIYMNSQMYSALGRPKAVALYYSHEDEAIAVQPAYGRVSEHFQVMKRQTGWAIHASTFCRHYKIRVPNTERFIKPDLDNDGVLVLFLRETVMVGGIEKGGRADAEQGSKYL